MDNKSKMSWEDAVSFLQNSKEHERLIYNSYLSKNLIQNCERFYSSKEFSEVIEIIKNEAPYAIKVLDLAAGNGIASYALAKSGYDVTALEPDNSIIVGRGAIEAVKNLINLPNIKIIDGYGENLPFNDSMFDVVYVRQALHHANNLGKMLKEIYRVLKVNGLLIATREHVVDNYGRGLKKFLNNHPINKLYGGENAFIYKDYINEIKKSNLKILYALTPYQSEINVTQGSFEELKKDLLGSFPGKVMKHFFSDDLIYKVGLKIMKMRKKQGRLYSFIAKK